MVSIGNFVSVEFGPPSYREIETSEQREIAGISRIEAITVPKALESVVREGSNKNEYPREEQSQIDTISRMCSRSVK